MRILPVAVGAALVAGIFLETRPTPQDVTQSTDLEQSQAQEEEAAMAEHVKQNLAARFREAPEGVMTLAEAIMLDHDVDPVVMAALTTDELNASYAVPFPDKQPDYIHTLLREAVVSGNVNAARDLIAAGADPAFNDNEMPHLAVKRVEGDRNLAFPDHTTGNALLQVWLEAGGNPNVHNAFYGGVGPLLVTTPMNNLEGLMMLLKAGADPWGRVVLRTLASGGVHRSFPFMFDYANANPTANEVMFRLAREGLIGSGPADEVANIVADFERVSGTYIGSTGPANLATIWGMQQAIGALYPAIGVTPSGDTAILMATDVPDDVGGFWLAEGETRSPETEDQIVTATNQSGDERWDG